MPNVLKPDEHHILKDLPFYQKTWATDTKARQDQLEQREKKRQEGKLRQASGGSRPATNSIALPQTKGKSASRSVGETLDLFPSASFLTSSSEAGTNQGSTTSPSIGARLNQEVDLVVSCIILKPEEDMSPNLRVSFKDRQYMCISEVLSNAPPLTKRTCTQVSHEELVLDASTT